MRKKIYYTFIDLVAIPKNQNVYIHLMIHSAFQNDPCRYIEKLHLTLDFF